MDLVPILLYNVSVLRLFSLGMICFRFSDHYRLLLRKERRRFLKASTNTLLQTTILISTHMRKQLYKSYCTFNGFSSFTHPFTYFSRNELAYQKFLGTRKSSDNKQKKYFYLSPKIL